MLCAQCNIKHSLLSTAIAISTVLTISTDVLATLRVHSQQISTAKERNSTDASARFSISGIKEYYIVKFCSWHSFYDEPHFQFLNAGELSSFNNVVNSLKEVIVRSWILTFKTI